jgi:hypothetical protein
MRALHPTRLPKVLHTAQTTTSLPCRPPVNMSILMSSVQCRSTMASRVRHPSLAARIACPTSAPSRAEVLRWIRFWSNSDSSSSNNNNSNNNNQSNNTKEGLRNEVLQETLRHYSNNCLIVFAGSTYHYICAILDMSRKKTERLM